METVNKSFSKGVAALSLLGGSSYLFFMIARFLPRTDPDLVKITAMANGSFWLLSISLLLSVILIWHRKEIKPGGFVGYLAAIIGFILIWVWLLRSGFILSDAHRTFSIWTATSLILFNWGMLLFGTHLLASNHLYRPATLLWMTGFLIGNAGLGFRWSGAVFCVALGLLWGGIWLWRPKAPGNRHSKHDTIPQKDLSLPDRFGSIDLLRGLIMVLMAIDHARFFVLRDHPLEVWNTFLRSYVGESGLFLTRFVTHFCAPGFFLLMGVGMALFHHSRLQQKWSQRKVTSYLMIRGGALVLLEKLFWTPIMYGSVQWTKFGVLFGLGGAMMIGALLMRLNRFLLLSLGLGGIILTQFVPSLILESGVYRHPLSILFLVPNVLGEWVNVYPLLPWVSVCLLGVVIGQELLKRPDKAFLKVLIAGGISLLLFVVVRMAGGPGNFKPPAGYDWISLLNLVKYPPSLAFLLLTLGGNCILLYLFEQIPEKAAKFLRPLRVFGKTALYFYFAHWFLYPVIGSLFFFIPGTLPLLYLSWIVGILLLLPVCYQYLEFKRTRKPDSLWRLL